MGLAFFEELEDLFDGFDRDPNVRAVIIKAAGKSFSAGTDLEEAVALLGQASADGRERMRQSITALQRAFTRIERCRKPVIAAIHSHCIGGGVDMICACDILFLNEHVQGINQELSLVLPQRSKRQGAPIWCDDGEPLLAVGAGVDSKCRFSRRSFLANRTHLVNVL